MNRQIPGLTGMRGAAALYVLVYHLGEFGWNLPAVFGLSLPTRLIEALQGAGWSGVAFFFVLSGYLLYTIYSEQGITKAFFIRRVFRTWPLYYVCIPVYLAAGLMTFTPLAFVYAQDLFAKTFVTNPFWTLCLEEMFYFLLFPFILKFKVNRTLLLAFSVAIAVAWGLFTPLTDVAIGHSYFADQMPNYFVCYAFGIWWVGRKVPRRAAAVSLLVLAVVLFAVHGRNTLPFEPLVLGGAYGLFLVGWQNSRFFTNGVSTFLGKISYGVYILQVPLLVFLGPLLALPMTIIISAASFYGFERRLVGFAHTLFLAKPPPSPLGNVPAA